MKYTYKITQDELGGTNIIRIDEGGSMASIPNDLANSDYQAYLNKDKPQVEHLTEIIPSEAKTK